MKCESCGKELNWWDDQVFIYGKNYCIDCFNKKFRGGELSGRK